MTAVSNDLIEHLALFTVCRQAAFFIPRLAAPLHSITSVK
ncbi:hypothetical protein HNP69_000436 [Chryseobacterium koreense]|nr:hypothetical protein [Chryseobacterium koreense]